MQLTQTMLHQCPSSKGSGVCQLNDRLRLDPRSTSQLWLLLHPGPALTNEIYKQEREREPVGKMEPGFLHAGCEGTVDICVEVASQQLDMLDCGPEKRTADLLPVLEGRTQVGEVCTSSPEKLA